MVVIRCLSGPLRGARRTGGSHGCRSPKNPNARTEASISRTLRSGVSASVGPNVQGSSVKVDHKSVLSANQSGLSGATRRWSRSSVRLNRCANIHSVLCFLIAMVLSDALRGGRYPLIPPKVVRSYPAANGPVLCQTAFTAPDPDELMLLRQSSRKDARNQVSCGFHGKPTHRFADAMIAATWGICRRW